MIPQEFGDIGKEPAPPQPKGLKERLYDKVRIPLRALDLIIVLLVVALITVIVIGTR